MNIIKIQDFIVYEKYKIEKSDFDKLLLTIKIIKSVAHTMENNEIVFLIQAGDDRGDGKRIGIQIILWLRVLGLSNQIFLETPTPFENLIKESLYNTILLSRGIDLIRSQGVLNLGELKIKRSEPKQIKKILRAYIDIIKIKHEDANWWGALKLIQANNYFSQKTNLLNFIEIKGKLLEKQKDLTYNIHNYISENEENILFTNSDTNRMLNDINIYIRAIRNKFHEIVYIDDHAYDGFSTILQEIIYGGENKHFIVIKPEGDKPLFRIENERKINASAEELFNEINVKKTDKKSSIDLVVADLRFYKNEDVNEFKYLTSFSLIYKLRRKHPSQRIMYFTSSNNFFEFNKILLGDELKYKPQAIFVKQGVEMNLNFKDILESYVNLTKDLYLLLKPESKKNKHVTHKLIDKERKYVSEYNLLQSFLLNRRNIPMPKLIDQDILVPDTNFLIYEDKKEAILNLFVEHKDKIMIHESVYCDLLRIHRDERSESELRGRCLFYINLIQLLNLPLSDFGMDEKDKEVKRQLEDQNFDVKKLRNMKDWADDFLVKLVLNCKDKEVLFITNDSIEAQEGNNEGPIRRLKKVITEEGIKSITVKKPKQILELWN